MNEEDLKDNFSYFHSFHLFYFVCLLSHFLRIHTKLKEIIFLQYQCLFIDSSITLLVFLSEFFLFVY